MARAYTVATIALALGTSEKWVDNVLSHYRVTGVGQSRQGIRRRISLEGVLELAVSQEFVNGLGLPLEKALLVARELMRDREAAELAVGAELRVLLDLDGLRRRIDSRLEFAVEAAPLPKRGRPAGKAKRGAGNRRPAYVLVSN